MEIVETVLDPLLVSMLHGEIEIPVYQHWNDKLVTSFGIWLLSTETLSVYAFELGIHLQAYPPEKETQACNE